MPARIAALTVLALATFAPPAAAQPASVADACRALVGSLATVDTADDAGAAFCEATAGLEARLIDAEERADALAARLAELGPWVAPPGAILLVDDVRGCPPGWTDVGEREPDVFAGRVPVAAGIGIPEEVPRHRSLGGTADVILDARHLPPHSHELPLAFARLPNAETGGARSGFGAGGSRDLVAAPARTGRETTARAGVGAPHENRPPFVGLYWCRRD